MSVAPDGGAARVGQVTIARPDVCGQSGGRTTGTESQPVADPVAGPDAAAEPREAGRYASAGPHARAAPSVPSPQHVNFTGTVRSVTGHCPDFSLDVGGRRAVTTDGSTDFKHGGCGDLKTGMTVTVDGVAIGSGAVTADEADRVGQSD